jgi:hypothetical protein
MKNSYTFEDVQGMTFEQLGGIDDPMLLMSTTHVSPMLVRYIVRTKQLEARYAGVELPDLLRAIDLAAAFHRDWPFAVGQGAPVSKRDARVDAYLDALDDSEPMKALRAKR